MIKKKITTFRFYAELNDFLSSEKKSIDFDYLFRGYPAIKDVIEALGVPHTEIDVILVNGQSVDFSYPLQAGDRVAVYPTFELLDVTPLICLRPRVLRQPQFILDVHLGKLAKLLRMLGFDTLYRNDYQDQTIIALAVEEKRIILTRDLGILKNKKVTHGHWLRATNSLEQLKEVVCYLDLIRLMEPFTRCLICNTLLQPVKKTAIAERLLPKTKQYFEQFYYCWHCDKIYWQGSHYEHMLQRIFQL